ncbi:hypothetical protein MPSEU_000160900 [Mayamaea pseudoterrestris]|nr:hypothetical protein MPSEU_000160900 [Mayamaea pseudoterrestris]
MEAGGLFRERRCILYRCCHCGSILCIEMAASDAFFRVRRRARGVMGNGTDTLVLPLPSPLTMAFPFPCLATSMLLVARGNARSTGMRRLGFQQNAMRNTFCRSTVYQFVHTTWGVACGVFHATLILLFLGLMLGLAAAASSHGEARLHICAAEF